MSLLPKPSIRILLANTHNEVLLVLLNQVKTLGKVLALKSFMPSPGGGNMSSQCGLFDLKIKS
jgi:hypothetical protein